MSYKKFQDCIEACIECVVESKHCANECLNEEDIKALARCIRLNHDSAAICLLAMEAMAGGSEFVKEICNLCAEICYAGALECEQHSHMEHCKKCAEACRKCAFECNNLSKI